jgi:hypothetical protein
MEELVYDMKYLSKDIAREWVEKGALSSREG